MKQYLDILKNILEIGHSTPLARDKMPATIMLPNQHMTFDMSNGAALLTCKEVHIPSVIAEVLWILRGDTNIHYLLACKCNIWNDNAYKYYIEQFQPHFTIKPVTKKQFITAIKDGWEFIAKCNTGDYLLMANNGKDDCFVNDDYFNDVEHVDHREPDDLDNDYINHAMCITTRKAYKIGDMGRVYGAQWRNWNPHPFTDKGKDQFGDLIKGMIKNPYSRYHKITAWNPSDMPSPICGQPNCHGDMQITCYPNEKGEPQFDLTMVQRSCDYFLGVPFNLLQYSIIGEIIQALTGYKFNKFHWVGVNVHVYLNQIAPATELLKREPLNIRHYVRFEYGLGQFKLENINDLTVNMFKIVDEGGNYRYHNQGKIKAELSVGL